MSHHSNVIHAEFRKNSKSYADPCEIIRERSHIRPCKRSLMNRIAFNEKAAAKQTRINHRKADPLALVLGGKPRSGRTIREIEIARDKLVPHAPPRVNPRAMLVHEYGRTLVKAAECVQSMPDQERRDKLLASHLPDSHMLRRMFASKPLPYSLAEVCERLRTIKQSGVAKKAFSWAGL